MPSCALPSRREATKRPRSDGDHQSRVSFVKSSQIVAKLFSQVPICTVKTFVTLTS